MIEESKQSVFVCFLSGKADSSSSESSTPSPSTHTTWQGQCWTHLFSYAVYRSLRSALLGVCVYSLFLCLQPLQVYQCLWAAEAEAHTSGQTGACFSPSLLFCFSVSTAWRRSRCRIPSLSLSFTFITCRYLSFGADQLSFTVASNFDQQLLNAGGCPLHQWPLRLAEIVWQTHKSLQSPFFFLSFTLDIQQG